MVIKTRHDILLAISCE